MGNEIWDGLNKISVIMTIIGFLLGNASGVFIYKKIINKNSNNKNINSNNKDSIVVSNNGTNNGIQVGSNNGDINA